MRNRIPYLLTGIILTMLFLAACSGTAAPTAEPLPTETPVPGPTAAPTEAPPPESAAIIPENIIGILWQWQDLVETEPAGQSVIANPENYTIVFKEDGTANVKADCNRLSWPYTLEGNKLTFNAIFATTLVACPPGSLSDQFLELLGKTETAGLENGRLILNLADDAGQMGFNNGGPAGAEAAASEQIIGITWTWLAFHDTAEENDITVPDPEKYTLRLQADGAAAIQADCNRLTWTYMLDGSSLTFDTLGPGTLASCPPDSLDQQYLGLLADVVTWVPGDDGKLIFNLKADSGNMIFGRVGSGESCVTGTITTADPQNLPEDAVIQIQIQDVSVADDEAKIIGEQILEAAGAQFPIAYKVCYDPADIDERFSYSMGVRIESPNGKLLFISDASVPVITRGFPTTDVEIGVIPVG